MAEEARLDIRASEEVSAAAAKAAKGLQTLGDGTKGMVSRFRDLTVAGAGVVLLLRRVLTTATSFVKEAEKSAEASARVALAFRNQGARAAALTRETLDLATSLARVTRFEDESIAKAAALLAALQGLEGEGLRRMTETALDLAESLDIDATAAARMIARGEDLKNALSRAGFEASETAKILAGLPSVITGTARAMEEAAGTTRSFSKAWSELSEAIGKSNVGQIAADRIRLLADSINELSGVSQEGFFAQARLLEGVKVAGTLKEQIAGWEAYGEAVRRSLLTAGPEQARLIEAMLEGVARKIAEARQKIAAPRALEPPFTIAPGAFDLLVLQQNFADTLARSAQAQAEFADSGIAASRSLAMTKEALHDAIQPAAFFEGVFARLDVIARSEALRSIGAQAREAQPAVADALSTLSGAFGIIQAIDGAAREGTITQEQLAAAARAVGDAILAWQAAEATIGALDEEAQHFFTETLAEGKGVVVALGRALSDAMTRGAKKIAETDAAAERLRSTLESERKEIARVFAAPFADSLAQALSGVRKESFQAWANDLGRAVRTSLAQHLSRTFFETLFSPLEEILRQIFTVSARFLAGQIAGAAAGQAAGGAIAGAAGVGAAGGAAAGLAGANIGSIGVQLFVIGGIGAQNVGTIGSAVYGLTLVSFVGSIAGVANMNVAVMPTLLAIVSVVNAGAIFALVAVFVVGVIPAVSVSGSVGVVLFGFVGVIGAFIQLGLVNAMVFGYVAEIGSFTVVGAISAVAMIVAVIREMNVENAIVIGGGGGFLGLQEGGIITRPTVALLHGGEAVIPLDRLDEEIGGSRAQFNITINAASGNLEDPAVVRRISRALGREIERRQRQ
jgi:hypothetical protein